jgi:hypothetical protein
MTTKKMTKIPELHQSHKSNVARDYALPSWELLGSADFEKIVQPLLWAAEEWFLAKQDEVLCDGAKRVYEYDDDGSERQALLAVRNSLSTLYQGPHDLFFDGRLERAVNDIQ